MQNGLIMAWDRWEMALSMGASATQDPMNAYGIRDEGFAYTQYTPDALTTSVGIYLSVSATKGGAGPFATTESVYTFQIPALSLVQSYTNASFVGSMSCHVEVDNLRIYQSGGVWIVKWDALRWYTETDLRYTLGPQLFTSIILTPAAIPLFGIPVTISAVSAADVTPGIPWSIINANMSASAAVTGGWRVKLVGDAGYTAFPVSVSVLAIPDAPSGCGASPGILAPSAGDTYSGSCSADFSNTYSDTVLPDLICDECSNGPASPPAKYHITQHDGDYKIRRGSVTLLPGLPMSVKKLNSPGLMDYAALIYRGGFPQVLADATNLCCHSTDESDLDPCSTQSETTFETHASLAGLLSVVENATSTAEAPFANTTYAPYGCFSTEQKVHKQTAVNYQAGACPPVGEGDPPAAIIDCNVDGDPTSDYAVLSSNFPSVQSNGSNPYMLSYLGHFDDLARYINYSADPHWSFVYWFPPDEDLTEWKVFGNKVNSNDYWTKLRTQYLHDSTITSITRNTRNHLITAPLMEGDLPGFIAANILGVNSAWWGITRFHPQDVTIPASITLDSGSSGQWSFTNCAAAFGADIVLTPTGGHTDLIAEYDLGQFSAVPFMFAHLCDRFSIDWVNTNVTSINVYLVNPEGDKVLLTNVAGSSISRPTSAADTAYAGSWGQDFSAGSAVADTGVDLLPAGRSAATCADVELVHAFSLLAGRGAAKLRYEIVVSSSGSPMSLHYPAFVSPSGNGKVIQDTGQTAAVLYPSGPGIRFGQWNFWDDAGGALLTTPTVRPMGQKSTVLDWMIWRRYFQSGIAAASGLDAEIATLYDAYEGQSRADVASDTLSCYIDAANVAGRGILVNALAELPPVCTLPRKARDSSLAETGSWAQEAWSFAQESMFILSAQHETHIKPPGGTDWDTTSGISVTGWGITAHKHIVDNTEGATYLINWTGHGNAADASPWHGYFLVWNTSAVSEGGICYEVSPYYRHFIGFTRSGNIWVAVAQNALPLMFTDKDTGLAGSSPCLRCEVQYQRQRLYLTYQDAGTNWKLVHSDDEGATWAVSTTIGSGGNDMRFFITDHGLKFFYWRDAGTIKGKILDSTEATVIDTFTAVASGVDADTIDCHDFLTKEGTHNIGITYTSSGNRTVVTSTDGVNFS